jgi:DNA-3-methyladenine glycosylase
MNFFDYSPPRYPVRSKLLNYKFYNRDPAEVAKDILGHIIQKGKIAGRIVETEAYYGANDPASRAFGKKTQMNRWMWNDAGIIFIYMVHGHWLFNIITQQEDLPSAILIRAVEPLAGMNIMYKNRPVNTARNLTSGPGKITQAFGINKNLNGQKIYKKESIVTIREGYKLCCNIKSSQRIGVRKDRSEPLRFYIPENIFVSKP